MYLYTRTSNTLISSLFIKMQYCTQIIISFLHFIRCCFKVTLNILVLSCIFFSFVKLFFFYKRGTSWCRNKRRKCIASRSNQLFFFQDNFSLHFVFIIVIIVFNDELRIVNRDIRKY